MPRSKKSTASEPPVSPEPSSADAHEAAENEGMAHVRTDELAGSPDIFASSPAKPATSVETAAEEPEVVAEAEPEPAALEAHVEPEAAPVATMPPPPLEPPPPAYSSVPPASQVRRAGSGIALGIVFVVVGLFFLVTQLAGIDLGAFGWPLFVIIPGLTLLIVGFVSLGTGAAIPGGIVTMVGLVLAYQNATGNWASWIYVWPLVAPGGVGVGLFVQGLRDRNQGLLRQGRNLIFIAALIFMVGFVFFESILHMSGTDYGLFGKVAAPGLLVVIGIAVLVWSVQRSKK